MRAGAHSELAETPGGATTERGVRRRRKTAAGGRGCDTWPRCVAGNAGPRRSAPSGVLFLRPLESLECLWIRASALTSAETRPSRLVHPNRLRSPRPPSEGAIGRWSGRALAAPATFGPQGPPAAFQPPCKVSSPLTDMTGLVNLREMGPPPLLTLYSYHQQ